MHDGHRKRLRERYLSEGLDNFQPHEALELLLFYAIPRRNTNDIAHSLLRRFGTLSNVLDTDAMDLSKVDGIGENAATLLSLIPSIARKYQRDKWGIKPVLSSAEKVGRYAVDMLSGRLYEVFCVICLDAGKKVLHSGIIYEGTINEAPFYPRTIVEVILRHNAESVVFAHNHPGGTRQPSVEDIEATRILKNLLEPMGISVIDHIIVADDKYVSMKELGKI